MFVAWGMGHVTHLPLLPNFQDAQLTDMSVQNPQQTKKSEYFSCNLIIDLTSERALSTDPLLMYKFPSYQANKITPTASR